jgi:hypothetical protein
MFMMPMPPTIRLMLAMLASRMAKMLAPSRAR